MPRHPDIEAAHQAIIAKKASDPLLKECRGYVFNLAYVDNKPVDAVAPVDAIIMGMNPGEAPELESGVWKPGETKWKNACSYYADAVGGRWATSEMFFWSSNNLSVLKARVGDFSPYLSFCANLNRMLIAHHRPKIVFQPGLGWRNVAVERYCLKHVRTVDSARKPGHLFEHYEMPDGTPWLSMPHWTALRGLRNEDKAQVKSYASSLI